MLSTIPMAFHQPMVDEYYELKISLTVFRELYEELFGGEEVERDVKKLRPDWFVDDSEAISWLYNHPDDITHECMDFAISAMTGNYGFGILFVVHNTDFWTRYSSKMVPCWEYKNVKLVSTKDEKRIRHYLTSPQWTGHGLVTLAEGISRLNELVPASTSNIIAKTKSLKMNELINKPGRSGSEFA